MINPVYSLDVVDVLDQAQWKIPPEQLSVGKRIGAGGCGWVYKGTLGGSGASVPVACKEVISATIDPDDLKEFQHEARMMTQLHHPYVITFYGVCEKIVTSEHTGDPEQRMYMVTELAPGGSLEGHIEDAILAKKLIASGQAKRDTKLPFDGTQMVKWALQIAAGKATFFCCSPLDVWSYLISVCLLLFFCFRHGPHSWPWFHTSGRQTTQCLAQRYRGCFDL
jgi:serine/threonine protein kinase